MTGRDSNPFKRRGEAKREVERDGVFLVDPEIHQVANIKRVNVLTCYLDFFLLLSRLSFVSPWLVAEKNVAG